jgi:RND superfamily putative drug exporter
VEAAGHRLQVPTDAEMLRVKAWMVVFRNATRDFLDVAALADQLQPAVAGATLARMDDYYADQREGGRGVTTQLVRMLAEPHPYDLDEVDLGAYRELIDPWRDWIHVTGACADLAVAILDAVADDESER